MVLMENGKVLSSFQRSFKNHGTNTKVITVRKLCDFSPDFTQI